MHRFDLNELSQAVRKLRASYRLTQQQFADKVPTAIRTLARWENNQPPHGKVLVRLAQLAEAQELTELASKFIDALQAERPAFDAAAEPELKGWVDGLEVAFRFRFRLGQLWRTLGNTVIDCILRAAADAREVGSPETANFEDLARQLRKKPDWQD